MVVLATKCYVAGDARERALDGMASLIDNAIGELAVETTIGVRRDDFVAVTCEGPDAQAARNVLAEEWGAITDHLTDGESYVGTLSAWDEDGWTLDAGSEIRIAADELGLGPGDGTQVRERFGLVHHTPIRFVYDADGKHTLADAERDRLYDWSRGDGRVNVNSATRAEVRATVNRAGHAQDIVTVERLGLLEQSIVCRDGTDPPGLLAAIGGYLPSELQAVVP